MWLLIPGALWLAGCGGDAPPSSDKPDKMLETEKAGLIYSEAPFPSAHASTVVETPDGIAAAWFGGTDEGNPDVGIWFSRLGDEGWTAPVEVANGIQSESERHPCWNPVLFQSDDGPLVLFYKVGPSPREWWGLVRTSEDGGASWSDEVRLPEGILGPIRAKPVMLSEGSMLAGSSTEHEGWVVHVERFLPPADDGLMWSLARLGSPDNWEKSAGLNDPDVFGAIQPTILLHSDDRIQMLCRSRQNVITQLWSSDSGTEWNDMSATQLPNPSAGIDAVHLADGRFLLIYNPTERGRRKLGLAISGDGAEWKPVGLLENSAGEYSYPAMIQASDGLVHITYTWKRQRIKYVVVDPSDMQ